MNAANVDAWTRQHRVRATNHGALKGARDYALDAPALAIPDMFFPVYQRKSAAAGATAAGAAAATEDYDYAAPPPSAEEVPDVSISTQAGFGNVLLRAAATPKPSFADRIMTVAPDVATSTNLAGFVNARGVFGLREQPDTARQLQVSVCL